MSETQVHQADAELERADGSVDEASDEQVRDNPEQHERLVPVSEAKKYRKRAQAAEKILEDFKVELAQKNQTLQEQQQTIADMQRQRLIDELLVDSDAIDLETTRLLTEMALSEMAEPDVEQAVAQLRKRKPFLFRSTAHGATALSPKAENNQTSLARSIERAAADAHSSGNRTALMRYLRLRRRS